jgi:hypothetical protein
VDSLQFESSFVMILDDSSVNPSREKHADGQRSSTIGDA